MCFEPAFKRRACSFAPFSSEVSLRFASTLGAVGSLDRLRTLDTLDRRDSFDLTLDIRDSIDLKLDRRDSFDRRLGVAVDVSSNSSAANRRDDISPDFRTF
jgi:hypothetical protein